MRVPKIRPFNRGSARKPNWWVAYSVQPHGEIREPTGAKTKAELTTFIDALERSFRIDAWKHPKERGDGASTFGAYAPQVIAKRAARGVKTAIKDEGGHVTNHLIPMFGDKPLADLTFQAIRDAFNELQAKGLAGRTYRNIHTTFRAILLEAVDDGLLQHIPPPLTATRGHLPPPVDKDPAWRETAVYGREEIGALMRCEEIHPQHRVMIATYFLTASRASEILPLVPRDYDRGHKPLASLTVPALKTKRQQGKLFRVVPVHAELKLWLDWWLDEGFAMTHGRDPKPDALLFPTVSKRRQTQGLAATSYNEIASRFFRDYLPAAGLRHRRLHDTRRTFLSLARSSGAPRDVARAISHKTTGDKILDAYTTWEWEALCEAVTVMRWNLPPAPGQSATVIDIERGRR